MQGTASLPVTMYTLPTSLDVNWHGFKGNVGAFHEDAEEDKEFLHLRHLHAPLSSNPFTLSIVRLAGERQGTKSFPP